MSLALSRGGLAVNARRIRRGKRISLVDILLWVMVTLNFGGDIYRLYFKIKSKTSLFYR